MTVPAGVTEYTIQHFFTIIDDDINEIWQSFALLAEISPDVPDNISCFQTSSRHGREGECYGRKGAVEVIINDNDRKFSPALIQSLIVTLLVYLCSNGHWIYSAESDTK